MRQTLAVDQASKACTEGNDELEIEELLKNSPLMVAVSRGEPVA